MCFFSKDIYENIILIKMRFLEKIMGIVICYCNKWCCIRKRLVVMVFDTVLGIVDL
ncbi:hypothetical protein Ark11_1427 [Candidatus Ichthyocystis hellenicum]|uniref:Uncharacterized protein n=1 Tax=Candidatus Ichthyocystis hellenicum TaxID=1561003 RepID=A0A0S4M5M9_9BURK|nr:hypothetical protein [Candidatus Ichthyocystis hellenicum]CUT18226.1 hypothetical protein Ark11_1427 [Candidatus Ichthyocystis hellenicum]